MNDSAQPESVDLDDIPTEIDHRSYGSQRDQRSYSEEQKALALAVYAETGSTGTAAQQTGIPATTIHSWVSRDDQIDSKLEALRRVLRERMAWKYADLAELAADELRDRLTGGDYHVDKEGNITRRKVPARELAFITSVCGDKHALLTGTMQRQKAEDQALTTLADKLVKALEAKGRQNRAVDVEGRDE
jgi:transposase-like protein